MTFEFEDVVFNLLDTPGHEDFSEDTYRTLTAVDSRDGDRRRERHPRPAPEIVRGIPAARLPIITFINKMDARAATPRSTDEIEKRWRSDTTGADDLAGRPRPSISRHLRRRNGGVRLWKAAAPRPARRCKSTYPNRRRNANLDVGAIKENSRLVSGACKPFETGCRSRGPPDPGLSSAAALAQFFSASAICLKGFGKIRCAARARRESNLRKVEAAEPRMSASFHKPPGQMDPNHATARLRPAVLVKLTRGDQGETGAQPART